MTNFPNGLASFGVPILPGFGVVPPGVNVFFVDSASGRDAVGRGSYDTPFDTIDFAIGQCTANQGDLILVMPGHTETVSVANGILLDVAGISVIGLGNGALRPTISYASAVGASVGISAANVKFQNFILDGTGIDNVTAMVGVSGANAEISDCLFTMADSGGQAAIGISLGAGSGGAKILRNRFLAPNAGANAGIYTGTALADLEIADNVFIGTFANACIHNDTAAITNALLLRNLMLNTHASGIGISVHASATGFAVENVTLVQANIAAGGSIAAAGMVKALNQGGENANIAGSLQVDPAAGGFA